MPKSFDKLIASRIRDVFDSHMEEYNPGDWKNMREKLRKDTNKKTIFLFPIIAKAASIILFIGLSVFYLNDKPYTNDKNYGLIVIIEPEKGKLNNIIDTNSYQKEYKSRQNEKNPLTTENNRYEFSYKNTEIAIHSDSISLSALSEKKNLVSTDSSKQILVNIKEILDKQYEKTQKMDSAQTKELIAIDDPEISEKEQEKQKHFEFGVALTSIASYSLELKGSGVDFGGGFSAGYRFSQNVAFETGMVIAKQSFDYNGGNNEYFADLNHTQYAMDNSLNMIDPNSTKSTISFVAIDIPMNLKFRYKRYSISTGLSSLLFVSEKNSYNYNARVTNSVYNNATAKYETQYSVENISDEVNNGCFNHFDFARLLNLSIGYNLPLFRGSIAFEPYAKIPLGKIGSNQMFIGSGGIVMKYCF